MGMINFAPQPPTSLDKIDFVGSPKHINITHFTHFDRVEVRLWIWSGFIIDPTVIMGNPNIVLKKSKVSALDLNILIEVGQYIKGFINPTISYDSGITSSNEGVYWVYEVDIIRNNVVIAQQTPPARYATLGYNWNYEGEGIFDYNRGSFGFQGNTINKYYNSLINYTKGSINLELNNNTTTRMIKREADIPDEVYLRCAKEGWVILYLNKLGIWDSFTPFGKVVVSNKIKRNNYSKSYRNPLLFNPERDFASIDYNINSTEIYTVNTGILKEDMGQLVEEILYSPRVYLVQFKGNKTGAGTGKLTVDTTLISADNTIISADATVAEGVGEGTEGSKYITFRQIPVVVTDTDFTRKNRLIDKNKISYTIKFEVTAEKINNIR